ncbi:MAG: serine/threonine-protein phosphatase [Synechococcaceae cyanobacterium SM2_3_2]|nr:serine/threonine-protein phosphatase [Synechococcaceae cyanobacterium SM2_3_2]
MMRFANATDPGRIRTSNQDYYYSDPDGRFFIVADGMGGHAAGATASLLAVDAVKEKLESSWPSLVAKKAQPTQLLVDAIDAANRSILEDQRRNPERADMGTTVVTLMFDPHGNAWSAHIGDSRLYRLRNNTIEQMTEDHTLVSRFIRQGDLQPEQARTHSLRHVLERCLGRQDTGDAAVQPIPVRPGDRFLLCSDGLTEELNDSQIAEYCSSSNGSEDFTKLPEILIEAAKAHGGRDNITVVIAEYS